MSVGTTIGEAEDWEKVERLIEQRLSSSLGRATTAHDIVRELQLSGLKIEWAQRTG